MAENAERRAQFSGRVTGLEQPHLNNRRTRQSDHQQRRQNKIPGRRDLQGTPPRGLRPEMVGGGPPTGKRRERQPRLPMERLINGGAGGLQRSLPLRQPPPPVAPPPGRPHRRRESALLVSFPEQPSGLRRRRGRPVHKVLEYPYRRVLELGERGVAGVLLDVEQARAGDFELAWVQREPDRAMEVPFYGEDGTALWSYFKSSLYGSGICKSLSPVWVNFTYF
ncbi:hypothetical protein U1Q18_021613 [Sarracenia purpurea var. burkii]